MTARELDELAYGESLDDPLDWDEDLTDGHLLERFCRPTRRHPMDHDGEPTNEQKEAFKRGVR